VKDRKKKTSPNRPVKQKREKVSEFESKLLRSVQQAVDWANGKPGTARVTYVPILKVDVKKVRTKLKMSQTQFAVKFGFTLDSIQNWEQGHRQPEGPARTLLTVIDKNPKAVQDALRVSLIRQPPTAEPGPSKSPARS
jgi:putative transcriptional regulator